MASARVAVCSVSARGDADKATMEQPDRSKLLSLQSRRKLMKILNLVTLLLVIVGGLNLGLVGAFDFDLVAALFGDGSALSRIVYVLVGLSALWQIMPFVAALKTDEALAEAGVRAPVRS
jgi:uncharacterized protein